MKFRLTRAPVTSALLAVITLVFIFEGLSGAWSSEAALFNMGGLSPAAFTQHQYWRLITAMFLHAGVLHWLTNCWALYQLGSLFEAMFGSSRFATVYFVTGLCASIASALHLPRDGVSVGASGAVLGILGAFIFSIYRSQWRHERWTKRLVQQLVFWGIVNITLPLYFPFIDNYAHVAGLLSGLILGAILPYRVPPPPPARTIIDVHPASEADVRTSGDARIR